MENPKKKLVHSRIEALKPGEKDSVHSAGNGLVLVVTKAGGKYWRLRFQLNGKGCIYSLGEFPALGLAEAQIQAQKARNLIANGIHPLEHKKKLEQEETSRAQNTFEAVARAWIEANKANWSAYYLKQIQTQMERYVFPNKQLNSKPINEVGASDIRVICLAVASRDKLKEGECWCAFKITQPCALNFTQAL